MDKLAKVRAEVARIQLYTQSEVLKQVLDYIDKVQKEPVSEDLEYASEKYACRFSSSKYGHDKIKATFKMGAQWQKEQKDSIVSDDLEDFALQYAGHHAPYDSCMQEVKDAVKAGAEWQKEQITAEAIDGEVGYWNLHGLSVNIELPSTVEEGDKVKVILIKEKEIWARQKN